MSGDNILNVFDDTEKDSSIDLGIDLNFDFRLESPLPVWTPVFSAQPSIITLNNTQVSKILDQIILELDQLKFGDYKAVANYHTVLDKLLMPFPAVTYKGITDADIKSKVDIIWHRSVTRNQGLAKNQKPFFANLNVGIRLLMIEHGFYVDTIDKLGKTILFDIIQLSTNNLLIPTLEMMRTQGTLTAVLASVFNNRILKKPQTVFEYLEAYMDRAITKILWLTYKHIKFSSVSHRKFKIRLTH